jgi:DegV family protein with EDD domain
MTVQVVTDSTADLPAELINELGITVVPLYVRFGETVYRDRVEISEDEFYKRLLRDSIHPTTSQPTPQDFAEVYQKLSSKADGIISIHISEKLSGTYNSASQGKNLVENGCPIEVVDSKTTSMALGLIAMAASTMAASGKSLQQITEDIRQIISSVQLFVIFDTLKYLAKGGRIGKAKSLLGSVLSVKPMLTIKDGEFLPVSQFRSRPKGIDKLFSYAKDSNNMEEMAIIHSTTPDEAQSLAERINSTLHPKQIRIARLGPVLGVHGGPGVLAVAFRRKNINP